MAGPIPRSRRPVAALAAVLLTLGASACSDGDDGSRPAPSSTVPQETACPVGDPVPDAAPTRVADPVPVAPPPDQPAGPGLDVGALLPRSGDLAFLGAPAVAAAELAVGDLNEAGGILGAPVVLRHGDSAEGADGAAEAAVAALLDAGSDVVIGPLSSSAAAAVLDRVAAADRVLVSPGATAVALDRLDGGGRLFRTVATESVQGRALAGLVLADGIRRVDLVVRADAYGGAVATGFTEAFQRGGGVVARRHDRPPADEGDPLGPLAQGPPAEATVLAGLADLAPVVDALVEAGRGPLDHPTYATDGALGERFGDLVAERSSLACLRGLLAVAPPDDDFATAVRSRLDALGAPAGDDPGLVLDHAAETYDAVVAAALATQVAGAADGAAIAAALPQVTSGGTPCRSPQECLRLVGGGTDLAYVGRSGPLPFGPQGNRRTATTTLAAFDAEGHLARLGSHPRP
ncbi:MAG TPA: ABC transporter substrate-binding protein [Acidimicrobiales bacterium]|nr:ABC transporter substrate-binding protein [Acidimicrobiales bacterium]